MPDTADWPWDAVRDHPLTAHRIPVTRSCPDWSYVVAFDKMSPAAPDEAETLILASYAAYRTEHVLTPWDRKQFGHRPFDMGYDNSTVVLRKLAVGEWTYRSSNWGAAVAWAVTGSDRATLTEAIDHYESPGQAWPEWKTAHPDVFGVAS